MQLSALDGYILHLLRIDLVEQIGVGDFRVFPHARATLHNTPEQHETDQDKDPEHDRLDSRIHQDSSFPAGRSR